MSTNDLRTVVQNTNDITKANSSIDLRISSNYTIEPINPKIVYREKMRLLRNKYAEESAIIKLSNANKKAEEEKAAIKERELFDIDVEKRKKERRLMESDITFDSELVDTSLQVDPVIKQKQEQV